MEEENAYTYAQKPGGDGSMPSEGRSSSARKVEKKKKKKSKHSEGEGNSADSPDGEHRASSRRTDEEGEEKSPKKRKSKKKSKEDREHRSSRKSKIDEAGKDEERKSGGSTDGDHRLSGQPKRADNDADMNARKPGFHSSLTSRNQASSTRSNSTSGSRPTESASAASNLSQFERDVLSKNEARRSARAATPGVFLVDEDNPCVRPIGAVASTGGSQYGKTSGRSSQASAARSAAAASAVAGGGGASAGSMRSDLRSLEDDVVARKVASATAGGSRASAGSMRSDLRTFEDDVVAKNRASSETNVTVVEPSARSRRSAAAAVGGAALVGGAIGAAAATSGSSSNQAGAVQAVAQLDSELLAMNQAQAAAVVARPPEPMTTFADVETPDEGGNRTDPHVELMTRDAAEIHFVADTSRMENYYDDAEAGVSPPGEEAPDMSANYQYTEVYPGLDFALQDFANEGGAVDAFVADNVVDALGVAVVISEEEEEKLEQRKYKRYLCFAFLCMCLIAVAIVVPIVVVLGKEEPVAPSIPPSEAPSMTPSVAPTSIRLDAVIESLIPMSGEEAFMNRSSPQYLAAEWVADLDLLALPIEDPQFVQRYILAVFYFSTNGDKWENCGRSDPVCVGDSLSTTWLSQSEECTWLANRCKDNVTVDRIFFSKTFGNNLSGTLPSELAQLPKLESLIMQNNFIRGTLPEFLGSLSLLNTLILSGNLMEGTIPELVLETSPLLGTIHLSRMNITGTIPTQFGLLPLADLRLDNNGLTGPIPAELGSIPELRILELTTNELDGDLPGSLFTSLSLATLRVGENMLMGSIPETVSQMINLEEIWMNSTNIGGTLPVGLYSLSNLTALHLSDADFSGTLSESVGTMSNMRFLNLENNRFNGSIPSGLDLLTQLNILVLNGNDFVGTISPTLCARKGTNFFDLQNLTADCADPSPQVICPRNCCDVCV